MVFNQDLGRTDGSGTATVGGKDAKKHHTERTQVEFFKNTVEETEDMKKKKKTP